MPGDQLFEDYDPDMEDIFGHKNAMTPRRVTVTEQQKNDPLRKPKVELQGILVAEKQPVTAKEIERRMINDYGQSLDPKKYGCNTLDDLLQLCSDVIVNQKRRDGVRVYMAKINEANQDIVEMVQQQNTGNEKKRGPRSFLTSGPSKPFGSHGASFRNYKVSKIPDDVGKSKGSTEQIKARTKLGPAKTMERLQNLADLLNECREEIAKPHPNEPGQKIVTLGALADKFKQVYGLPAWGKIMTESELHKQLDVPQFAGVLTFRRLQGNGDILVEVYQEGTVQAEENEIEEEELPVPSLPVETKQQEEIPSKTEELNEQNGEISVGQPLNQSIATRPLSSAADISLENFSSFEDESSNASMLITEAHDDGFFESGPGFGGNIQSRPAQSAATPQNRSSDTTQRFGNGTFAMPAEKSNQQSPADSSNVSQSGSQRGGSRAQSAARRNAQMPPPTSSGHRAIVPQNPLKVLADYVKSRVKTKFESLPDDDKSIVNCRSDIFKIQTTLPSEVMVTLVNPDIDTSSLVPSITKLRDPIEADFRWMSESLVDIKRGRRNYIKPVMFIAPRGFLCVVSNPDDQDLDSEKMALMEDLLRGAINEPAIELTRKTVRPGMPAVYIYRQGSEVRYYRVLIVGKAHQIGDVMVLLADHNEQYLADVQFAHLFELPEKINFAKYAPNVIFASLYGTMGLSLGEQHNMWKNLDDEERKQFIVGYIPEDNMRILSIDMVWRDQNGQLDWLSRILKRRGAIVSPDTDSIHLTRSPQDAVENYGPDSFMDFVDYSIRRPQQNNGVTDDERSEPENQSISNVDETIRTNDNSDFLPQNLNMYSLFDKVIAEDREFVLGGMFQFVSNVKELMNGNTEWENLFNYMDDELHRRNIRF